MLRICLAAAPALLETLLPSFPLTVAVQVTASGSQHAPASDVPARGPLCLLGCQAAACSAVRNQSGTFSGDFWSLSVPNCPL
jgi:hypothetical protein